MDKQKYYEDFISHLDNKNVKYGVISSTMITEQQINYLKSKYLVADTGKFAGSSGVFYLVCKG